MTEESQPKSRSHSKIEGSTLAWGLVVIVVTGIITWFAFAAAYGVGVGSGNSNTPTKGGTTGGGGPDYIYMAINANPDRNQSTDQYTPANFTVPTHTLLIFQITNYDNGENPIAPIYSQMNGTVGNLEYLNGSTTGVSSVPVTSVAHTFTILKGPYAGFNVAMPAASTTSPTVVTFEAYFNSTGSFVWQCMAPCDSPSMASLGFMMGTMTVVNG